MQRRNFLRGILGIAATAAAAPLIKLLPDHPVTPAALQPVWPMDGGSATIGEYADYISISDMLSDPHVKLVERELSYRLALTLDSLVKNSYDLRTQPYVVRKQYVDIARFKREMRKERYFVKQRRRSARMAA